MTGRSRGIWVAAVLIAAALHCAAAAAILTARPSDVEDDDEGAPAIEIGIELAAPRQEPTNLPPGPEADNSAASTASIAQQKAVETTEAPIEEDPVESEEPDRVVASRTPAEMPVEDRTKPKDEHSQGSAQSAPSEAAAAPSVETAKPAPASTAPTPGTGTSALRVRTTWQRQLIGHLNRNKRYPPNAAGRAAEIVVAFTIDRTGRLLDAKVAKSSGDARFDEAALAMLRRADPLPMPPPVVADDGLTFSLPVIFKAAGRP